MTYSSGGLIQATDFNGFVSTTSGSNINDVWSTGSGDKGWGQTAVPTVSVGGTVNAADWANLVTTLSKLGTQTNTTITSRSNPSAGQTISILANVATDITSCTTNRGNAASSGTTNTNTSLSGTVTKTTATGSGAASWTITFTSTVTFASANAARYFFNAGGLVKIMYGFGQSVTDHDPEWNTATGLAGQCGAIYFSGRVNGAAQTISGTSYTGTTRVGGSGGTQTTLATTTGFYSLTAGAAATTIFQLNNATSPYTGEYIRTTVALNAGSTVLTFVTTWVDAGTAVPGATANISGGTAQNATDTSVGGAGTGPTTLVNLVPPSTSQLTASWASPSNMTVAGTVA